MEAFLISSFPTPCHQAPEVTSKNESVLALPKMYSSNLHSSWICPTGRARLASSDRLGDVNFPAQGPGEQLASDQIFDLARRQPSLGGVLVETSLAVGASVGQQPQVVLDVALAVMSVRYVASEIVELDRAYGAHACGEARAMPRLRAARGVAAVAGGRLEGGEAGGEGRMQKGERREAEELVVHFDELIGEHGPPLRAVECAVALDWRGGAVREEACNLDDVVWVRFSVRGDEFLGVCDSFCHLIDGTRPQQLNKLLATKHEL